MNNFQDNLWEQMNIINRVMHEGGASPDLREEMMLAQSFVLQAGGTLKSYFYRRLTPSTEIIRITYTMENDSIHRNNRLSDGTPSVKKFELTTGCNTHNALVQLMEDLQICVREKSLKFQQVQS